MNTDEKRIARNTLYLYGRMFLTVWISLYTSRMVLERLGVVNYGVYSVLGGIVIVLSFLNGTLSNASARFISFEMGLGNEERLNFTFASSMHLHIAVAIVMFILAETGGLWYINHQLVIPADRMFAANICYQMSVLAVIVSIIQVPFSAVIMAHEHMDAVAVIAIVNVFLKLGAALGIALFATSDTLVGYSLLMAMAAIGVFLMYAIYAWRHFPESHSMRCPDGTIRKSMMRFGSWDIYGSMSYSTRVYGIIVILNRFGGGLLNAAGSLALQVSGTIMSFTQAVTAAFRPQIIKQYAAKAYDHVLQLLYNAALYSFLLMALLIIPVGLEAEMLLKLWLCEVPAYTTIFSRLSLLVALFELLITVVTIGIHATGRVMRLSLISGSMNLLMLPAMLLVLHLTGSPVSIYCLYVIAMSLVLLVDTFILKFQLPQFSVTSFWWRGVIKPAIVSITAAGVTMAVISQVQPGWPRLLLCGTVSTLSLGLLSWIFVFPASVRQGIRLRAKEIFTRKCDKK